VTVGRLDIAVFMGLAGIGSLRLDLVIIHQGAVPAAELAILGEVVDRRAEAVATMLAGYASQFPKGLLQPAAYGFERFGKANRGELPVGIGQGKMIQQVIQRLMVDGNAQGVHAGEVGSAQSARIVNLGEHDGPAGSMQPPPVPDPALEGPPLGIGKPARIALLQPAEQGKGPQSRLQL